MQHRIAVDGIILRIRPGCSRDGTREGALLAEDIVELKHDGQWLALQEALRELRIPYKLIGVHTAVIISTATADRETGVQAGSPRSGKRHAWTIRELPGLEVAGRLKLVLCLIVSKRTIERELCPVVAIA